MARKAAKKAEAKPAENANEFGYVEGEEFPYKVGDEFSGSPTQISRFMKMVYSQQGKVVVEGDTIRIIELSEPKETEAMQDDRTQTPNPDSPEPSPTPPAPAPAPDDGEVGDNTGSGDVGDRSSGDTSDAETGDTSTK